MRTPANAPARARKAQVVSFPPPTSGWVSNQNLVANTSSKPGAVVLDNFWPTPQTVRIRRGCALYSQPDASAVCGTLMTYDTGSIQRLFSCIGGTIWDVTSASEPVAAQTSLIGGEWSWVQFATTGGVYLIAVNGVDPMQLFDGARWWPITGNDILQVSLGTVSKGFAPGEAVTGSTSGATGTVLYANGSEIYVTSTNALTFSSGETLTGSSGGNATTAQASQIWFSGIKAASGVSITSIDTKSFSFVWSYMSRLWFIQGGSLNAWYLAADAFSGDATPFPMGGIFEDGGALMFGSSWSLDNSSSNGLSEQCVMCTQNGEVAVYQGVDPNLSSTWGKVGLYRINKPRGKRAFIRNGGDLLIATDEGLIPLTQAVERNPTDLALGAVSFPIQDAWAEYVSERPDRNWQVMVWPEMQMIGVAVPASDAYQPYLLVVNTNTTAWARFTGWDCRCFSALNGQMYFGSTEGRVIGAWQTGYDIQAPFTAIYAPLFHDLGGTYGVKIPKDANVMMRGTYEVTWAVSMMYDYIVSIPAAPMGGSVPAQAIWNQAEWNSGVWNQSNQIRAQKKWSTVAGQGYALSPCLQITSGNLVPFDNEIVRIDVTYLAGGLLS
ncbi:hypothetical protein AD945_08385 [Gluconobacter albidus]|uniref:Uncharacterized protein n=1 Tax=Gluconobacter albidus TaxID=318683 RepID=A0A149TJK5_9PROT|nr:hypothetical protein [Gluconobacter albidus]KXV48212.1 hypothetical protein AD945_08385 [Gluconobacter albidus]